MGNISLEIGFGKVFDGGLVLYSWLPRSDEGYVRMSPTPTTFLSLHPTHIKVRLLAKLANPSSYRAIKAHHVVVAIFETFDCTKSNKVL